MIAFLLGLFFGPVIWIDEPFERKRMETKDFRSGVEGMTMVPVSNQDQHVAEDCVVTLHLFGFDILQFIPCWHCPLLMLQFAMPKV